MAIEYNFENNEKEEKGFLRHSIKSFLGFVSNAIEYETISIDSECKKPVSFTIQNGGRIEIVNRNLFSQMNELEEQLENR